VTGPTTSPRSPTIRIGLVALAVAVAGLLAACDAAGPEPFEREVVVESYQMAGEPAAPVRLSRSIPLDSAYTFEDLAVRDATVWIEVLDEDGEARDTIPFAPNPDSVGFYVPTASLSGGEAPRIRPLGRYRLRAETLGGASIRATTTVPDTFSLRSVSRDTAAYLCKGEEVAARLTPSITPGRDQAFYIFSTESLEPTEENLVPLVAEFLDRDENTTIDDVRITSSPILNEAGYTVNGDGTFTLRLPWVAVAFYGPNRTRINVIDANLYDFVRSQTAQQGGGGFTPGAIPNVIETVEGGTGVFGSMASVAYEVFVVPQTAADPESVC